MDPRISIEHLVGASVQGVLSSTLIRDSRVLAVLPAYIRQEDIQDVVFIHSNYLVVKQYVNIILEGGGTQRRLDDVAIKSDFDANILAARIIGHVRSSAPGTKPIRSRETEATGLETILNSDERFSSPESAKLMRDSSVKNLPPQILVMTLERSGRDFLVFLCAKKARTATSWSQFDFEIFQRPLALGHEEREALRVKRHLAVDPGSRLVAVGANERNIVLYRLKERSSWWDSEDSVKTEFVSTFNPVAEEKRIHVSGAIHKMEFLESPRSEPHMVILLLIVGLDARKTVMHRYDWDSTRPLSEGVTLEWPQGFPLRTVLSTAHLLMPLATEPGFILVANEHMARFSDVLTGSPNVTFLGPLSDHARASVDERRRSLPDSSRYSSKWTAWARPIRRIEFMETNDHFYMCREDGTFQFCELARGSNSLFSTTLKMDITNDTAFAVLPSDGSADFIVTSNGLFRMPVQDDPMCEQPFADCSPLQDFLCTQDPVGMTMLACSSRIHGLHSPSLHRIRTAYQATVIGTSLDAGILPKNWILPMTKERFFIVSSDQTTQVEAMSFNQDGNSPLDTRITNLFDTSLRTIYSQRSEDGLVIQVTTQAVRLSSPTHLQSIYPVTQSNMDIDMADYDTNSKTMILAINQGGVYRIKFLKIAYQGSGVVLQSEGSDIFDGGLSIRGQPTCACIAYSSGNVWAAVGTWRSELLLLKANSGNLPIVISSTTYSDTLFESLILLNGSAHFGALAFVVCGLRNGSIATYLVDQDSQLQRHGTASIGSGAVRLVVLDRGITVTCDGKVYYGRSRDLPTGNWKLALSPVTLVDPGQSLDKYSINTAVSMARKDDPYDMVALFSDRAFYVLQLDTVSTQVIEPLNFFINEDSANGPTRVTHAPTHLLSSSHGPIIAYQEAMLMEDRLNGTGNVPGGRRQLFSRLGLIGGARHTSDSRDSETDVVVGNCSGEIVHDLVEWNVKSTRSRKNWIVACTERRPSSGRIYLYTVSKNPDSGTELELVYRVKFDEPVNTASPVTDEAFAVCHGKKISILTLRGRSDSKSELRIAKTIELRSTGRQITLRTLASGLNLLYIATDQTLEIVDIDLRHVAYGPRSYESQGRLLLVNDSPSTTLFLASGSIFVLRDGIAESLDNAGSQADSSASTPRFTVQEVMEIQLMNKITRLRPHPSERGRFIASGKGGAFYQLSLIREREWQLLRFIQNMAEQSPAICPLTFRDKRKHPRIYAMITLSDSMNLCHINGDILIRVLKGGTSRLNTIINDAIPGQFEKDVLDASARRNKLTELMQRSGIYSTIETSKRDILEVLIEWLRETLEPCM